MLKGFKDFIMRGNVIDLAVAVVIGAAFNAIVGKVVDSLVNPIIGMFFKADSLDTALMVSLPGGGAIGFGAILGAIINFLVVAAVIYFVFVLPVNKMRERADRNKAVDETEAAPTQEELLAEIRDLLKAQQS